MKDSLLTEVENSREDQMLYEEERLVLEVTEAICELMQKQGIKRSALARKLGFDKSYITQILDGSSNMTLKTIANIFAALDSRAKINTYPLINQIESFSGQSEFSENYYFPNYTKQIENKNILQKNEFGAVA